MKPKIRKLKVYIAMFGLYNVASLFVGMVSYVVGDIGFISAIATSYVGIAGGLLLTCASTYCLKVIFDETKD